MTILERWRHQVHEVPRAGISQRREANADLREAVSDELGELGCPKLVADYKIKNLGKGRFGLGGRVEAVVTRACVVTLEPIEETVSEVLDCIFVPPEQMPGQQAEEEEVSSADEYEPIENDLIAVGRVVFEVLAAGLNPYPRKDGVEYVGEADALLSEKEAESSHPFAALAQLKKDRDNSA